MAPPKEKVLRAAYETLESPDSVICRVVLLDCLYGRTPPPNENVLLLSSAGAVCEADLN